MKTCWETEIAGFGIVLEQHADRSFRTTYGREMKDHLSYSRAAAELGRAIMHALACESKLDNSGP